MLKLKTHTLGCKVNQYDSALLENIMCESSQFRPVLNGENPDIILVNTCAVTRSAGAQARQEIRKLKRKYPKSKLFALGCYARVNKKDFKDLNEVDELILSQDPIEIYESIKETLKIRLEEPVYNKRFLKSFPSHTRAFLKVQDGCDSFCSYCIVPFARGKPKSMPVEDVIKQISIFHESGYKEIVLSGVHLGMYGRDVGLEKNLLSLLHKIEEYSPINRIRLSSIEPDEISDELIKFLSRSKKILNHLHLPLQSGNSKILDSMNRKYDSEFFAKRVKKIFNSIPECAIGTDVIAGFPGEGEQEFNSTYNLIQDLPVSYMHVFPFSLREGTKAETLTERVHSRVIKQRCELLRKLGTAKKIEFRKSLIGTNQSVLIEEENDKGKGFAKGLTGNYVPVLTYSKQGSIRPNSEIDVRIERIEGEILIGKAKENKKR